LWLRLVFLFGFFRLFFFLEHSVAFISCIGQPSARECLQKERAGRAGWENFDVAFELCDDTVSFGGRHDDLFVQGA
jgi:hypothetical protein